MINVKELRIGNLFMDDEGDCCVLTGMEPYGDIVRCDGEEGCVLLYDGLEDKKEYEVESRSAYPYELTEEWLLRLGFKKYPWGFSSEIAKEKRIALTLNDFFAFGRQGHELLPIETVHQLQNLYFALTGEELQIK